MAVAWCEIIAKEMRKESIDEDVIRTYFWFIHNTVIDKRVNLGEKFDHVACKVHLGNIIDVDSEKNTATVETPRGEMKCNASFINMAAKGDRVATHFDYITEKVSPELEGRMNSLSSELASFFQKMDSFPRTGNKKMRNGV